jgi:hypothetical protein
MALSVDYQRGLMTRVHITTEHLSERLAVSPVLLALRIKPNLFAKPIHSAIRLL